MPKHQNFWKILFASWSAGLTLARPRWSLQKNFLKKNYDFPERPLIKNIKNVDFTMWFQILDVAMLESYQSGLTIFKACYLETINDMEVHRASIFTITKIAKSEVHFRAELSTVIFDRFLAFIDQRIKLRYGEEPIRVEHFWRDFLHARWTHDYTIGFIFTARWGSEFPTPEFAWK